MNRKRVDSICVVCLTIFSHRADYSTKTCSYKCKNDLILANNLRERREAELIHSTTCTAPTGSRWIAVRHRDKFLFAAVDDDIFDRVSQIPWSMNRKNGSGYASHHASRHLLLHTLVIGTPPTGLFIDHINRNKLDNRRVNLRFVTAVQNAQNRSANKSNQSGFKGVWKEQDWRACITVDGKKVHLGSFDTAEDAARAYDKAARNLLGETAFLNFPDAC